MQNKIDADFLKKYCAVGLDYYRLNNPFSDEKYTYASNGHMIIRVPRLADIDAEVPEMVKSEAIFAGMDASKHGSLPEYEQPKTIKCNGCNGTGKSHGCPECEEEGVVVLESSHNEYEVECKSCGGTGSVPGGDSTCDICDGTGQEYVDKWAYVDFGEAGVRIRLLEKIKDLPGVKIGQMDNDHMVHFSFDGGDGALMGMRKD